MNFIEVISLARDIVIIVAMLLSAGLAVFVFVQFAPKLQLRIIPRWADETKGFLILEFELENNSRIRVHKQKIQLQILEHEVPVHGSLSEWVPFDKEAILPQEQPKEWHDPIEILRSTKYLNPGEMQSVERLCYCPQDSILHVGLQAKAKLGALGRLAAWLRSWNEQWTSTIIVMHTAKESL
ncbi:MAG: hypothetical protein E3J56_02235 [Candidatus Aminicenantes bacterium]|nr:MAG: hypothetical protein E3J56_02235 [Candidatus Aminicenantes bacterium]